MYFVSFQNTNICQQSLPSRTSHVIRQKILRKNLVTVCAKGNDEQMTSKVDIGVADFMSFENIRRKGEPRWRRR